MPQNPEALFSCNTVKEELLLAAGKGNEEKIYCVAEISGIFPQDIYHCTRSILKQYERNLTVW